MGAKARAATKERGSSLTSRSRSHRSKGMVLPCGGTSKGLKVYTSFFASLRLKACTESMQMQPSGADGSN
eukprot:scaffold165335_cov21-Tisochrysis_lutea.AAC.1